MYTEYERFGKEGKWGLPKAVDKCPTQLARNSWPPSALTRGCGPASPAPPLAQLAIGFLYFIGNS